MPNLTRPVRRGVAKNITLDVEANEFLVQKCAGNKTQGRFISAVLLAERARDEERTRLKEQVARGFAEAAP